SLGLSEVYSLRRAVPVTPEPRFLWGPMPWVSSGPPRVRSRAGPPRQMLEEVAREGGRLVLVGREVSLARAAHRTEPGLGDVLELGVRRDPAVRVTDLGVVDEPARFAHVLHGAEGSV